MDKNILINVGLLTGGGLLLGYTLVQVVAGRISSREVGVSILAVLGCLLIGFWRIQGEGSGMLLGMAGSACLLSSSLLAATKLRRGTQRLPPSGTGRNEFPRGDRPTLDR